MTVESIICTKCKEEKPTKYFSKRVSKKGFYSHCNECRSIYYKKNKDEINRKRRIKYSLMSEDEKRLYKERARSFRIENWDKILAHRREVYKENRKLVIEKYGGCCACCGEELLEFLAIDHINGNGNKERKKMDTSKFLVMLKNNEIMIDKYRILCHNCNMSMGFYGYCPHERSEETKD